MRGAGVLYLASADEPRCLFTTEGLTVNADWLVDVGDTVGFIEWDQVAALTWRWSGEEDPE